MSITVEYIEYKPELLTDEGFIKVDFKDIKEDDSFRLVSENGELYKVDGRWLMYAQCDSYPKGEDDWAVLFYPYKTLSIKEKFQEIWRILCQI